DDVAASLGELTEGGLALLEESGRRQEVEARPGELPWLADLVKGPPSAQPLLAGIRAAGTLDDAIRLRGTLRDDESIITPNGTWLGRHWLRINRSDDPEIGVIARGEEIARLKTQTSTTGARVEDTAKALADTRTRIEQLEDSRKQAQNDASSKQQRYAETKTLLESSRTELEQLRGRARVLDATIAELAVERQGPDGKLEECTTRRAEAARALEELGGLREQLESERNRHQSVVTEARATAEQHRQVAHELAIKVESRRNSKESASAALARVLAQQ